MPIISKTPLKYELPFPGQVFQKEEQDGRWEYGLVDGVKVTYLPDAAKSIAGWQASLTSGFRQYRGEITHTATYQDTTKWHPAPAGMQALSQALGLIAGLSTRIEEQVAKHEALVPASLPALVDEPAFAALEKRFLNLDAVYTAEVSGLNARLHETEQALRALTDRVNAFVHPTPEPTDDANVVSQRPPERPRRGATA
jgi:hypothetical protein